MFREFTSNLLGNTLTTKFYLMSYTKQQLFAIIIYQLLFFPKFIFLPMNKAKRPPTVVAIKFKIP